jgi:hypothetical protein
MVSQKGKTMSRLFLLLTILLVPCALAGCGSEPTPFPRMEPIAIPTVITVVATDAQPASLPIMLAPSITPGGATPTTMPAVKTTPTITPTVPRGSMRVQIFMIAQNDNGKAGKKIGCGDSIVAVDRIIPSTTAPLTAALKELFSLHEQNYGQSGLANALYHSNLKIDSINLVNLKAIINLSGKITLGGECDSPRAAAQIKETALQFSTVKDVVVNVNNVSLDQILSGKGN